MKALLAGQRRASLGVVLGLVGMLCLLAVSTGLAIYGMSNLHKLRVTIYQRCLQRAHYDQAAHDGQVANAQVWKALADIAAENPIPPGTDPKVVALYERQVAAINTAKVRSQAAADAGVIGSCRQYR